MFKDRYKKITVLIFLFLLSANIVSAHTSGLWMPGDYLIPCAGTVSNPDMYGRPPCNSCELWHLLKHLVDFILIAAAPILATLFFIVAGVYIMLGGANPGMLSTGKSMFKNTMVGLLIVMLAWLMVNTLIQTLVDPNARTGQSQNWWEFTCTT